MAADSDAPPDGPHRAASHGVSGGRATGLNRMRRVVLALAVVAAGAVLVLSLRNGVSPDALVADETIEPLTLDAGATAGELTLDDAAAPEGRRVDAWRFYTDTDEPLSFTVAAAFVPALAVGAPDGTIHRGRPDSADSHLAHVVELRGKGEYRVTVSSREPGATGRYVLTVHQDPIPLELVPDGQPRPGELGVRGRALRDGRYQDRHAFEARRGQPYLVIMDADSLFGHVVVRSPEGDSLGFALYERLRTARGGHASVARFTPRYPGRYFVDVVSSAPGGVGHYMLALKTRTDPVPITYHIMRGVLGLVSQLRADGYVDVFTFDGRPGRAVAFEVRPPGFSLALVSPAGDTLVTGPRVGTIMRMEGQYRVEVATTRPRGTGSYDLIPALPPVPPPPPDTTQAGMVGW